MSRIVAHSYRTLLTACGLLAGLAIAGLAFMITLDVILRNLGLTNFPWLLEVSEYVLFIVTFGAAPWVLNSGSHVRVDLLVTTLPKRAGLGVELLADLLGFTASAILGWHGLRVAVRHLLQRRSALQGTGHPGMAAARRDPGVGGAARHRVCPPDRRRPACG